MTTTLAMFLATTMAQVIISSDPTLVSHPNGALVPEYTPEVAAARLQHLQELQALQGQDGRGRQLLDLLLLGLLNTSQGGYGGYGRCDTAFCQVCTEYGACRKNCGPVCRGKCCQG